VAISSPSSSSTRPATGTAAVEVSLQQIRQHVDGAGQHIEDYVAANDCESQAFGLTTGVVYSSEGRGLSNGNFSASTRNR
jgi:hypothetical protein